MCVCLCALKPAWYSAIFGSDTGDNWSRTKSEKDWNRGGEKIHFQGFNDSEKDGCTLQTHTEPLLFSQPGSFYIFPKLAPLKMCTISYKQLRVVSLDYCGNEGSLKKWWFSGKFLEFKVSFCTTVRCLRGCVCSALTPLRAGSPHSASSSGAGQTVSHQTKSFSVIYWSGERSDNCLSAR